MEFERESLSLYSRCRVATYIGIHLFCGQEDIKEGQKDTCGNADQILLKVYAQSIPVSNSLDPMNPRRRFFVALP